MSMRRFPPRRCGRRGLGSSGDADLRAPGEERADAAARLPRDADAAAVVDQPMAERRPFAGREEGPQIALDLLRIVLGGEAEPVREPAHVGVDEDRRLPESGPENDVRRLPPYAGERAERLHRLGDPSRVLLGDRACGRLERLRLLPEETGPLDERLD